MSRQETTPNAIPQPEQSLAPAGAFPRPPQPEAALHVLNTVPQPATMPSGVPYGLPGPHDAIMPQTSIPPGVLPTSSISVALPSYGTLIHGNKILRDEQPPKFGQGSFRMLPYDTVPKGDPTRKWLTIGVPSTMNKVIFDYLITQGYPAAAARFAKEAGIPQPQAEDALDRIEERKNIRLAILKGEIESAIYQINDYDAKILDTNLHLHYSLLRAQLISLIRTLPLSEDPTSFLVAQTFARENLAPKIDLHPDFAPMLEWTMGLMLFSESQFTDEHRYLISQDFRAALADRVNRELLASRGEKRQRSRLEEMVKTRVWAEKKAREKGMALPERLDVGLEGLGGSSVEREADGGDGAEELSGLDNGNSNGNDDGNGNGNDGQAQDGDAMET